MSLIIPSLGISIAVQVASIDLWNNRKWNALEREMQSILDNGGAQYPHAKIVGAHSDIKGREFKDLNTIKYNALVIYNNTRYRVKDIFIVEPSDTHILNDTDGITLITCHGRRRLIVRAF